MKIAFVLWLCLAIAESCPDNCKCSKYKIFCKDSRIRSLPKGLPTTQTLSMDGDILDHLNASVFLSNHGLRNLTTLVLINLQIQDIQNARRCQKSLTTFDTLWSIVHDRNKVVTFSDHIQAPAG
ncbi:hypothetical protein C0J52_11769 [Blattella germanica]|nr:hypothetical protein C0J52_11769 [Blattella germanica]